MIDAIYNVGLQLFAGSWWSGIAWPVVWSLIKIVVLLLPLMGAVAYLTLWERRLLGFMQARLGPNRVGPAGLLAAYRFIADTRDQATNERLDNLEDPYRLFRCHTIMHCVDVCPKGLNPTKAIGKIKDMMVSRAV